MSVRSAIFGTTSLVFIATGASADVSANDIWTDWQNYMASFGYSVDGTETMSGNTLNISNLKMSIPVPEADGNFELSLDSVDFVENGDGTVNLVFSETMPMSFVALGPEGEAVSGSLDYTMSNMEMRASGEPDKVQYDYSADQIGMTLTELVIDDEALSSDALEVSFTSNGLSGQSIMEPGALRKVVQTMALGATQYKVAFVDPESDAKVNFDGSMASVNMQGDSVLPISFDPENVQAALESGFAVDGTFSYTGSKTDFSIIGGGDDLLRRLGGRADGEAVILPDHFEQLVFVFAKIGLEIHVDAAVFEDLNSGFAEAVGDEYFRCHEIGPLNKYGRARGSAPARIMR